MQSLYIYYICILRREREKKNEIQTTNVLYSFQRFIVEQRQCVFRFLPRSNGMLFPPPTLTSPSIRMHKVDIAYFTILSVSRARESGHAAWRLSLPPLCLNRRGSPPPFPRRRLLTDVGCASSCIPLHRRGAHCLTRLR
ncbi:unnamed protein product [Ixodes persulcatus]